MVKKILNFLSKEFHGVNEAALLLGTFTFLSQILGLIRDRLFAHIVGVSPLLDTYYASFRIPDFLYVSVASLASITVLMPFISKKLSNNKEGDNKIEAQKFLNNIFSVFLIFMILICILVFIFMPKLSKLIAPGFNNEQLDMLVNVSRIMLLSPIFIGLSNLIGTITQFFKNFLVFSLSPLLYNLGIIFGIIFLYPIFGIYGLAFGVVLGAILHFAIQIPTIYRHGFFPKLISKINWKEILLVVKTSLPRTLALSASSFAFMALIALASKLKAGSISLFTFSYNLQSVPVGIIGISYSVAVFPILVESFAKKDLDTFLKNIVLTFRQIIFWSLPIIVLMVILRAQIVRVLLGTNAFSWADTRLTAAALALFVISLFTQSIVLLLIRAYYASGNTIKPLLINVSSSILMIVFSFIFINIFKYNPYFLHKIEILLRVENVPGTTMLALPIAFTLGSIINFILMWFYFKKDFLSGFCTYVGKTFIQVLLGSLSIGVVSYFVLNVFSHIFNLSTFLGILLQGLMAGTLGIVFGILVLVLLKNQELKDLALALKKKFWKKKVINQEQPNL